MAWHTVAAAGAGRDLWVHITGHDQPQYGRWVTPAGLDVDRVLASRGPEGLDVDVWWVQAPDHPGKRETDFLWNTGLLGLKVISHRMRAVFAECGAALETFEADVRMRSGAPVEGYVAVLEQCDTPGPVHSLWRGRRGSSFVVSTDVRDALKRAGLTGLDIEEAPGPFPGDQPGYFEDD